MCTAISLDLHNDILPWELVGCSGRGIYCNVNCKLYNIHILVYKRVCICVYRILIKSVCKYCMDISPTWVSSAAAQVESPHGRRVAWVEVGGPGKVELVH